jgi:hypothetical protein
VPPDEDWNQLIEYLGEEKIAGGEMKEAGCQHRFIFSGFHRFKISAFSC